MAEELEAKATGSNGIPPRERLEPLKKRGNRLQFMRSTGAGNHDPDGMNRPVGVNHPGRIRPLQSILPASPPGPMSPNSPSLVKTVLDGGILMGPFLLMILLWIACTIRFAIGRGRTIKGLVGLMLFPVAFGVMTLAHGAFHWNKMYEAMEASGYPDATQHIQSVLIVSRSCVVMVSVAGLSLASATAMFMLPLAKPVPDEAATSN